MTVNQRLDPIWGVWAIIVFLILSLASCDIHTRSVQSKIDIAAMENGYVQVVKDRKTIWIKK